MLELVSDIVAVIELAAAVATLILFAEDRIHKWRDKRKSEPSVPTSGSLDDSGTNPER